MATNASARRWPALFLRGGINTDKMKQYAQPTQEYGQFCVPVSGKEKRCGTELQSRKCLRGYRTSAHCSYFAKQDQRMPNSHITPQNFPNYGSSLLQGDNPVHTEHHLPPLTIFGFLEKDGPIDIISNWHNKSEIDEISSYESWTHLIICYSMLEEML